MTTGIAQKLFNQRENNSSAENLRWPNLQILLNATKLSFIDLALAEELLASIPNADEGVAALICHLSIASRNGHLCIEITEDGISPSPVKLWTESIEDQTTLIEMLSLQMQRAAERLPDSIVTICSDRQSTFPLTPLCRYRSMIYFQRHWIDESRLLALFSQMKDSTPSIAFSQESVKQWINLLISQEILQPAQGQALERCTTQRLSIITGGPGTGKTFTAGQMINMFWGLLQPDERSRFKIVLAAPTGKAAGNLKKSLDSATKHQESSPAINAYTLHSLLGFKKSGKKKEPSGIIQSADLIIVDECSMIGLRLMRELFEWIKPGARLILLGDPSQLPPVETGSLFTDMVNALDSDTHAKCLPSTSPRAFTLVERAEKPKTQVSKLTKCLRAESQDIIDFAQCVKAGDSQHILEMLKRGSMGSTANHVQGNIYETPEQEVQALLIQRSLPFFEKGATLHGDSVTLLKYFSQFRILSPLRKGALGVDELNSIFLKTLQKRCSPAIALAIPLILAANNSRYNLFNGETGVLIKHFTNNPQTFECSHGDYALFPASTRDENERRIPAILLPKFEYAFCQSIHKSQGSEFDHVIMLLPQGAAFFGKEALYTGATRARKQLEVWGEENEIKLALTNNSQRQSGFNH